LTHVAREENRAFLACAYEGYSLELVESHAEGHLHTAWRLAPDVSLAAAARHLDDHDVGYGEGPNALVLRDPDGHELHLVESPPVENAPPPVARLTTQLYAFHPRKLGHVSTLTANLQPLVQFYGDILGLRVTDWLVDDDGRELGAWLTCGGDHHVYSVVETGTTTFHHVAFEIADWGELRVALDHLAQHGRWLSWGPVRHGIGQNLAAYVRTPEVHALVELYADMEQVTAQHRPRRWPDTPHSSNVWGVLPPRSYFRFDDEAIESERLQLEAQGHTLEPAR